jgi:hypothetical protein
MSAYLKPTRSVPDRVQDAVEKSFSKFFFTRTFLNRDSEASAQMGVGMRVEDYALVALTAPLVLGSFWTARTVSQVPIVGTLTDKVMIEILKQRLASYGTPEFTTDASQYKPVASAQPAVA